MVEAEHISRLIGNIYDAALDPRLWTDVLNQTSDFVGGSAASLYSKNVIIRNGEARYSWNLDPAFLDDYFSKYVKVDPVTVGQFFFGVEEIYSVSDIIPYEEFIETAVYKEWAKPRGWVDHLAATLEKSGTSFALFGVFRDEAQGLVDDDMRRRMRLLVPHMRRAVLIGNVIDLHKVKAATLSDAFDALEAGVFLVDKSCRIVFANVAGQALLDDGAVLSRTQSALTAVDPHAARILLDVVAAASNGDSAIGVAGIAVPLSNQSDHNWLAHVLPLTSGARHREGKAHSAVAAVFVRKVSVYTPPPIEAIAKLYRLTPSEVRVLNAMLNVSGVPNAAKALGISEATVKTHLQHLFGKTGLRRQADLIKLVAVHANPFRS